MNIYIYIDCVVGRDIDYDNVNFLVTVPLPPQVGKSSHLSILPTQNPILSNFINFFFQSLVMSFHIHFWFLSFSCLRMLLSLHVVLIHFNYINFNMFIFITKGTFFFKKKKKIIIISTNSVLMMNLISDLVLVHRKRYSQIIRSLILVNYINKGKDP